MKRDPSSQDQELLKLLKDLDSMQEEYPAELHTARRSAFLEQVAQSGSTMADKQTATEDQKTLNLLAALRSIPVKYPQRLLAARRAAYVRRLAWMQWLAMWTSSYAAFREGIMDAVGPIQLPSWKLLPAPLVLLSLAAAFLAGYMYFGLDLSENPSQSGQGRGVVQSGQVLTADRRMVRILCKPGFQPPQCLAAEFPKNEDLIYQGNGTARPAVAKDTLPDRGGIHKASYVNDGLYGPGASWISNSRNSWIKIDLGKLTRINTVTFGRDRLGKLNDGDPGQFVVAVAFSDNVYANGNGSNDNLEYVPVYRSDQVGFSGTISGAETVMVQFDTRVARFIKITFENKGTAIDEVEAFMAEPPLASAVSSATRVEEEPEDTATFMATVTAIPPDTETSVPAWTPTLNATDTPVPTDTSPPVFTATPLPTYTSTSLPSSTPVPTDTLMPVPTSTSVPPDTETPVPPSTERLDDLPRSYDKYLTAVPFNP